MCHGACYGNAAIQMKASIFATQSAALSEETGYLYVISKMRGVTEGLNLYVKQR